MSRNTISRRTVAKGIAWTAPVVAVAGTAPAFAVSPIKVWPEEAIKVGCKLPGGSCEGQTGVKWGYTLALSLCTNSPEPVEVTFGTASLAIGGGAAQNVPIYADQDPSGQALQNITIPANGCVDIYIYASTKSSAESTLTGSVPYTYFDGNTTQGGVINVNVGSTPPCVDCAP